MFLITKLRVKLRELVSTKMKRELLEVLHKLFRSQMEDLRFQRKDLHYKQLVQLIKKVTKWQEMNHLMESQISMRKLKLKKTTTRSRKKIKMVKVSNKMLF